MPFWRPSGLWTLLQTLTWIIQMLLRQRLQTSHRWQELHPSGFATHILFWVSGHNKLTLFVGVFYSSNKNSLTSKMVVFVRDRDVIVSQLHNFHNSLSSGHMWVSQGLIWGIYQKEYESKWPHLPTRKMSMAGKHVEVSVIPVGQWILSRKSDK